VNVRVLADTVVVYEVPPAVPPSRVTRYPVIAAPPVLVGGAQLILPLVADTTAPDTLVGADGTVTGGSVTLTVVSGPVPAALMAATESL
jgi:hypothetical protein